jgi:hypothetical protein
MQSISGLSHALQWHLVVLHVHSRSQVGTMLSAEFLLNILAFMRIKQHKSLEGRRSFLSSNTALLCFLVLNACMYCCLYS